MSKFIHYSEFDIKNKLINHYLDDILSQDVINYCILPYVDTSIQNMAEMDISVQSIIDHSRSNSPNYLIKIQPKNSSLIVADIEMNLIKKLQTPKTYATLWSINFFPPEIPKLNYKGLESPLSMLLNRSTDDKYLWFYLTNQELQTPFCIKFINCVSFEVIHIVKNI
jgi:hypothetical protein